MKKTYCIFLISVGLFFGGCAGMLVKKGNKKFANQAYAEAATLYQKALDKKPIAEAKIQLAHTYRLLNNAKKAEDLYREVVAMPESEPINQFYFGDILMQNQKYDEAKKAFQEYAKTVPDDKVTKNKIYACENHKMYEVAADSCSYFELKKIEVSGMTSSYGAAPFNFGYVFSAEGPAPSKKTTDKYTGNSYLDLFFIKKDQKSGLWSAPEALKGGVNSEYHDAFATFSADGQTMYFTRSNEVKGKPKRNKNNESTLQILKATFLDGEWTNIEPFPYNSDDFSNAHPSLSRDGKTLYYSSDRPGGFGTTDIYMCTLDGGKWGEPVNLGPTVNTSAREAYPMISFNEKLYFASEGHPGLGGYDVFVTARNGSTWSEPENVKSPVNSSKDDFSFSLNDEGMIGNLSSTRFGNDNDLVGNDQMYEVVRIVKNELRVDVCLKMKTTATSQVEVPMTAEEIKAAKKKAKKGKPAPTTKMQTVTSTAVSSAPAGIPVTAKNLSTAEEAVASTDANGIAHFSNLTIDAKYSFTAGSSKYLSTSIDVNTAGKKCTEIVNSCLTDTLFVEEIKVDEVTGEDPTERGIGDIYYDFDKWDIRPDAMPNLDKLVKILTANPNLTVEMGSHTDCRGTDEYNQRLSENRAKSVVKYCTNRDINPKRLKYKGYGETQLLEKCACEECTDQQHQTNRRTNFRILDTKKK